jgi:hypothetical protein
MGQSRRGAKHPVIVDTHEEDTTQDHPPPEAQPGSPAAGALLDEEDEAFAEEFLRGPHIALWFPECEVGQEQQQQQEQVEPVP